MLTKEQVLRIADAIHGWCGIPEMSWLYDQARQVPADGTWVEVGTFKGRSLAPALLACGPTVKVISVDNCQGHEKSPTHLECNAGTWVRDHVMALNRLSLHEGGPRVTFWDFDSVEAAYQLQMMNTEVDAVYLDRDYRDEGAIETDVQVWLPLVKPGGLLCGRNHGIDPKIGGIGTVIDDLLPERVLPAGSIWAYKKPG